MNPGLCQGAVLDRLKQFGYNELPSGNRKSISHIIIEVVKEPMFILLLICGSLYLLLGEYAEGVMKRPPRKMGVPFFGIRRMLRSLAMGVLLFAMVLGVYFMVLAEGHSDEEVRAIAFSTLIIGNIFLILTTLSKSRNAWAVLKERNTALLTIIFTALMILLALVRIPNLGDIFNFSFPGWGHFGIALLGAFSLLLILETIKYWKHHRHKVIR